MSDFLLASRLRFRALELTDEGEQVGTQCLADLTKLDEIQPPLAALVLRHEGLVDLQDLGEVHLAKAALDPHLSEHLAQALMVGGEDGLLHRASRRHPPL